MKVKGCNPGSFGPYKPENDVSRKGRQKKNGNSPRATSSNPSPERSDEMSRGESPLVDEHSGFKKISYGS
jgi:hypothetical protein